MKKPLCLALTLLVILSLCACGAKEPSTKEYVQYHVLSRYVLQSTGDVNVTEYSYDESWLPLGTETRLNGEFASSVEYVYSDDKTQLTMNYSSATYDAYSTQQKLVFDTQGRLIKASVLENGEVGAVSEYFYDAAGREVKVISTAPGNDRSELERRYDEEGKLLCFTVDTGYYTTREDYFYDEEGRLTSIEYYRNDKLESVSRYSHEDKLRYGTVFDAEGKVLGRLTEVLDEAGNVLECERFDALGNRQSYTVTVYAAADGSVSGKLPE